VVQRFVPSTRSEERGIIVPLATIDIVIVTAAIGE
jgi:hypothetical protein